MSDDSRPQPSKPNGDTLFSRGIFSGIKSKLVKAPTQPTQKTHKKDDGGKQDAEKVDAGGNIWSPAAENARDSALGTALARHSQCRYSGRPRLRIPMDGHFRTSDILCRFCHQ